MKRKVGHTQKMQRKKRRDEVHRLHFEYGYPGRKIAEMMNINRNTINADIDYWYTEIESTDSSESRIFNKHGN